MSIAPSTQHLALIYADKSTSHVAHVRVTHVAHVRVYHVAHVRVSHVAHVRVSHVAHVTASILAAIAAHRLQESRKSSCKSRDTCSLKAAVCFPQLLTFN